MTWFPTALATAFLLAAGSAGAADITEYFHFDNLSSAGGTVSGSFIFDDSGAAPFTLIHFSISDSANAAYDFDTATTVITNDTLRFNGSALSGSFDFVNLPSAVESFGDFTAGDPGSPYSEFTIGFPNSPDTVSGGYYVAPEPSTWAMLGLGALGLLGRTRRRRA